VDYASVKEYAASLGAILKLVSAKEGKNINVLLILFRICLIQLAKWQSKSEAVRLPLREEQRSLIAKRKRRKGVADICLFIS
jgi:hypothetical protein